MIFKKFNNNPKETKTGDCVIRAIAQAEDKSWLQIYELLCGIGSIKYRMPNDKLVYENLLEKMGWVKHKMPKHTDNTRYKVEELINDNSNKSMIITVANHMTFAEKGVLIDTWDCRRKSVGNYWTKEGI